jgi:hypothetical protein
MRPRPWTVLANQPVRRLEDNLLVVHGPAPKGNDLERTMTVMRRSDGRLLIHSAIALDEVGMGIVEGLGEPAFLVVPNAFHRLDAHAYKTRYPELRVFCPAPAIKAVREVVAVDGALTDLPADPLVRVEVLERFRIGEGVFTIRSGAQAERASLVFNDIMLNMDRMPGAMGFFFRMLGGKIGPGLHPMLKRLADRARLREQLRGLADTPGLCRLIPGHGAIVESDAAQVLQRVADDGK